MRGKHFSKEKHSNKKTNKKLNSRKIRFFSFILIIIILILLGTKVVKDQGFRFNFDFIGITKEKNPPDAVDISKIPDKMGDYEVLGVIVIDKIELEKNIIETVADTDPISNLAVTKLYGPNLNEQGNFCIAGHNYTDIFKDANELEIGDSFYIVDKAKAEKVTYKIYDKYSVNPTEVDRVLNQETNGKKEVTLITCNPGGYTRLIIKAQEK